MASSTEARHAPLREGRGVSIAAADVKLRLYENALLLRKRGRGRGPRLDAARRMCVLLVVRSDLNSPRAEARIRGWPLAGVFPRTFLRAAKKPVVGGCEGRMESPTVVKVEIALFKFRVEGCERMLMPRLSLMLLQPAFSALPGSFF